MNETDLLIILTAIMKVHDPLERTYKAIQDAKEIIKAVRDNEAQAYRG
jgi:hypothetical protein